MAKKKASGSQLTMGVEDIYPEPVQDAADEYVKAMRVKNKATEKFNSAADRCIQVMQEHNCPKIRIDEGSKWLKLSETQKLKTEKIKEATSSSEHE